MLLLKSFKKFWVWKNVLKKLCIPKPLFGRFLEDWFFEPAKEKLYNNKLGLNLKSWVLEIFFQLKNMKK